LDDKNVVTLEQHEYVPSICTGHATIRPRDFLGIKGYPDDLANAYFSWKSVKRDDGLFLRVLTLVDANIPAYHEGSQNIQPMHLLGCNGYEKDITSFKFCWRNFYFEGVKHRVVTLEK
jgi:hypothetical protein